MDKREYTIEEKIAFFEKQLAYAEALKVVEVVKLERRVAYLETKIESLKASLPKVDPPA